MSTSLATLETDLGYLLGCTISTTSRWTTTQVDVYLNRAQKKVVDELIAAKCWKLLREIQKEAEYTLTGTTSYNVYTVIGSSTDYYAFVGGKVDYHKLREVTIEDEDKIQATGEYYPTGTDPWICFYGYDSTTNHGNLPVVKIRPSSLTGTLYFRYLKAPPTMQTTETAVACCLPAMCENAILFLTAAWCWSGDRNTTESSRYYQMYQKEIADLIGKYEEPSWDGVDNRPVI